MKKERKLWQKTTAMFLIGVMLTAQMPVPQGVIAAEILQNERIGEGTGNEAGGDMLLVEPEGEDPGAEGQETGWDLSGDKNQGDMIIEEIVIEDSNQNMDEQEENSESHEADGSTEAQDDNPDTEPETGDFLETIEEVDDVQLEQAGYAAEESGASLAFSFRHIKGGHTTTDINGEEMEGRILTSRGRQGMVDVNLRMQARNFGNGTAQRIYFTLQLPYFYFDENGVWQSTYSEADLPEQYKPGQPDAMYIEARMQPEEEGWIPSDPDHPDAEEPWQHGQITYTSVLDMDTKQDVSLPVQLCFYGSIPENMGGVLYLGGGFESFKNAGVEYGGVNIPPETISLGGQYTMICSNLNWEIELAPVEPKNTLWDRYNYLVFRETVKNVSDDEQSVINCLDLINLKVPVVEGEGYGLALRDAMRWRLNAGGGVAENTDTSIWARQDRYVGKPNEGGVLIYDVTGIENIEEWDLEAIQRLGLEPLSYLITQDNRILTDNKGGKEYSELTEEEKEAVSIGKDEEKVYYFAVPMSPDNVPDPNEIRAIMYATINFGNSYTWTKIYSASNGFELPRPAFSQDKYLLTNEGTKTRQSRKAINETVEYYLDDFSNTGNLPEFNVWMEDRMDPKFQFEKISVLMDVRGENPDEILLDDWFRPEETVELLFARKDTKQEEFIALDQLTLDEKLSDTGVKVWSLNIPEVVRSFLNRDQNAAKYEFANGFRIYFKERIERGETMPGKILVSGRYEEAGTYQNAIQTGYEHRVWRMGRYEKTEHFLDRTIATVTVAVAMPQIQVDAFKTEDGNRIWNANGWLMPYDSDGVGFRYCLGSDSEGLSAIIPGMFESGTLASVENAKYVKVRGFLTEKVLLSEALVALGSIEKVRMQMSSGQVLEASVSYSDTGAPILTLDGREPYAVERDGEGHYVIPHTFWDGEGEILNLSVKFRRFPEKLALSQNASENTRYLILEGSINSTAVPKRNPRSIPYPLGVFRTDYPNRGNARAEDDAWLQAQKASPQVEALGFSEWTSDGMKRFEAADPATAPVNVSGAGFQYRLWNNSISKSVPALFHSGTLLTASEGKRGFIAEHVLVSEKLGKEMLPDEISFYTTQGDEPVSYKLRWTGSSDDLQKRVTAACIKTDGTLEEPILLEQNERGEYVLPASLWNENGDLSYFEADFAELPANMEKDAEKYLAVDGTVTIVSARTVTATFSTDVVQGVVNKDVATLHIANIKPVLTVVTRENGRVSNENKTVAPGSQGTVNRLSDVPSRADSSYEFTVSNACISDAHAVTLTFDMQSVGRKTNAASPGIRGFDTKTIILSGDLGEEGAPVADIEEILLYDWDTPAGGEADRIIPFSSLTRKDDGSVEIQISDFAKEDGTPLTRVRCIKIRCSEFYGQLHPEQADKLSVSVYGKADWYDDLDERRQKIYVDASLNFKPDEATYQTSKVTGGMSVPTIKPVLTEVTHDTVNGRASEVSTGGTIRRLMDMTYRAAGSYEFTISNESVSPAFGVLLTLDVQSVGNKSSSTVNPMVFGFTTEKIVLSGDRKAEGNPVADIEELYLYDWDTPSDAEPDVRIPFSSLVRKADGTIEIDISAVRTDDGEPLTKLRYIKFRCNELCGQPNQSEPEKMVIRLEGRADWYDEKDPVRYLDARLDLNPDDSILPAAAVIGGMSVPRPYLGVYAYIDYYNYIGEDIEKSPSKSSYFLERLSNMDENRMHLAIPYDRDFKYRVRVENVGVSPLDDTTLTITLPINDATGTNVGQVDAAEVHTGFHTTKMEIRQELLERFADKESVVIALYDADSPEDGVIFSWQEDSYVSADGKKLPEQGESILLSEATLLSYGISNLRRVEISGKQYRCHKENEADTWVDFYGFSDSLFGTDNIIDAQAVNYLACVRDEPRHRERRIDDANAYISKMYFGTVTAAGYKNEDSTSEDRLDVFATPVELVRFGTNYDNKDNSELDVGYKSIGSYMIDFRQFLNVGSNLPVPITERAAGAGCYWGQESNRSYIQLSSLNTAVDVTMHISVPDDSFDAYYLKIDPRAWEYLQSVTVTRRDGSAQTYDSWTGNSVEISATGERFCRIDLAKNGADFYEEPNGTYAPDNPVADITVKLRMNQEACDSEGNAQIPDYGTWYFTRDQKTKYMFELTGRFYRESTAGNVSELSVSTDLKVGGSNREGVNATAKVREQQGGAENGSNMSDWSYWNTYITDGWASYEYEARRLYSKVWVAVYQENNSVAKGVHTDPLLKSDVEVEYGSEQDFAVSFYQSIQGGSWDYLGGTVSVSNSSAGRWYWQDRFDWSGKHAFTDEIRLEDTLPAISGRAGAYNGFKTNRIYISEKLYPFVEKVEFYKTDGSTESVLKDSLVQQEDGERHEGFYTASIAYPEDTLSGQNVVKLSENEFITKYRIILKDVYGDGDYAAELKARTDRKTRTEHDTSSVPDVYVSGNVYSIRPTDSSVPQDVYNTMAAASYAGGAGTPYRNVSDKAYMMSYRLPFQGGVRLDIANESDTVTDYVSTGGRANLDPSSAAYSVRVWNRPDTDENTKKSSKINSVTLTNEMNENYRLKNIYIPAEFLEGEWFRLQKLSLVYHGITQEYSFEELMDEAQDGYFQKVEDQYVFDVNRFVREHVDSFARYNANAVTNTRPGAEYVKEYIQSFTLIFAAHQAKQLEAGIFLNPKQQKLGVDGITYTNADPVFTYDGVYVDRTTADIEKDAWTYESRPTVINSRTQDYRNENTGHYNVTRAVFKTAAGSLNAQNYGGDLPGTKYRDCYKVENLVSCMYVNLKRSSEVDGEEFFAYDVDLIEKEDDTEENVSHGILPAQIFPDDYVVYELTVGAKDYEKNTQLPVYHPDLTFEVPQGQRIVGWRVKTIEEGIKIEAGDITANVTVDGNLIPFEKDRFYSLQEEESSGTRTDYKKLSFSVGDLSKDNGTDLSNNQIPGGKEIVLILVTQMTDEIEEYEGKITANAVWKAAARPLHTYSQYRIAKKGYENTTSDIWDYYYADQTEPQYAYYYRKEVNGPCGLSGDGEIPVAEEERENLKTYVSTVNTRIRFFEHNWDMNVDIAYENPEKRYDTQPVTLSLIGWNGSRKIPLENESGHTLDQVTFTVSFLQDSHLEDKNYLYKGIELTRKPDDPYGETGGEIPGEPALWQLEYPENMQSLAQKPIKVEYYFCEGEAQEDRRYTPEQIEKGIWIEDCLLEESGTEKTIVIGDMLTEEQRGAGCRLLKDALKVRWTYYDIPVCGDDGENVVFADLENEFKLYGLARYCDIRLDEEKERTPASDVFKLRVSAEAEVRHHHTETVENTVLGKEEETPVSMKYQEFFVDKGTGTKEENVLVENPALTVHTQFFKTEEDASSPYEEQKEQMTGYRPGNRVWFKTTVENRSFNQSVKPNELQGVLLDPVVFDKIPEYITACGLDDPEAGLRLVWYDSDGNRKESQNIRARVSEPVLFEAPDYGGDMITQKADNDGAFMGEGKAFADLILGGDEKNTECTEIAYKLYIITFECEDGEEVRLETGERFEIYYQAEIREEDLPLAYTTREGFGTFVDYYPKIGEYYQRHQNATSYTQPLVGQLGSYLYEVRRGEIQNADIQMDMNFLCHDVGVSGRRNENVDKFAYLKNAKVFLPGSSEDSTEGGSNSYLKDQDLGTGWNQQMTRYVPGLGADGKTDELPGEIRYTSWNRKVDRDYYTLLMQYRNTAKDWQQNEKENGHHEAVLWAQARLHLQTAWLAASTHIVPIPTLDDAVDEKYGLHLQLMEYLPTDLNSDKRDNYENLAWSSANQTHKFLTDDTIATLEKGQNFIARVSAYNYGDWDLSDGVEFVYVLPEGTSLPENYAANMRAYLQSGTDVPGDMDITGAITDVAVTYGAYQTPATMRDPLLSDASLDKTGAEEVKEYNSAEYLGGGTALTFKVKHPLYRWFNRAQSENAGGYTITVDIPCQVDRFTETEYWYDEVMIRPIVGTAREGQAVEDSRYVQIYDRSNQWGHTSLLCVTPGQRMSMQIEGMNAFFNAGSYLYLNGSPAMPYIDGMNISNKEVSAQNTEDSGGGRESFKDGTRIRWASTGTRAHMRKPVIRTWTMVGDITVAEGSETADTKSKEYYVNPIGDKSWLNIVVENKYWLQMLCRDYWSTFMRCKHTYAADGGSRGTLFEPVITDILPPDIIPVDEDGKLFSKENRENEGRILNWTLYDTKYEPDYEKPASASAAAFTEACKNDAGKDNYTATVKYLEEQERFQIIFRAKDTDTKILSEERLCFSFQFVTNGGPDKMLADGSLDGGLLEQYQKNHVFVTSSLEYSRFLLDEDMQYAASENPFWVGSPCQESYNNTEIADVRSDCTIAELRKGPQGTVPVLPKAGMSSLITDRSYGTVNAFDSSGEEGNHRYMEAELSPVELETYTDVRPSVLYAYDDFNGTGKTSQIEDEGIHTTNRIRAKYPYIENRIYVTREKAETGASLGTQNLGGRSPNWPRGQLSYYQKENPVVYGENLYYQVLIENSGKTGDYIHQGDVLFGKFTLSIVLPKIVTYCGGNRDSETKKEDLYLIYEKADGSQEVYDIDTLRENGYDLHLRSRYEDPVTYQETLIFDIATRGDAVLDSDGTLWLPTEEALLEQGKKLPGRFDQGEKLLLGLRTRVDRMEAPDMLDPEKQVWDEMYKADSYVTITGNSTALLKEEHPQEYENLGEYDVSRAGWVRESKDSDESNDWNQDGKYGDRYSADISAKVVVMQPRARVRLDTSVYRVQSYNPDYADGMMAVTDPAVKGGVGMKVFLTEAVNEGTPIPEFMIDYKIPYRATLNETEDEAPVDAAGVINEIRSIGTGRWEIPSDAGIADTEEYMSHLELHVYALLSSEGTDPASENLSYIDPKDTEAIEQAEADGLYIDLTELAFGGGVDPGQNRIIDMAEVFENQGIERKRVYQLRFVIRSREGNIDYPVPRGIRLAVDADPEQEGHQYLSELDPLHRNVPESLKPFVERRWLDAAKQNAAYVDMLTENPEVWNVHVNHFAQTAVRYDDDMTHVGRIGEASRAGYFVVAENPLLEIDLTALYFKYTAKRGDWKWDMDTTINGKTSKMLKYKITARNYSREEIDTDEMFAEVVPDNARNVQLCAVLPYVQNIDQAKDGDEYKYYREVSYADTEADPLRDDYAARKKLDAEDAIWSWHVEAAKQDEEGNFYTEIVKNPRITQVSLVMYDKVSNITSGKQRRIMRWQSEGVLRPGERLVIDYMVPVNTEESVIGDPTLMDCKGHLFKMGAFMYSIPFSDSTTETYAYELDPRDINQNGWTNENTLTKTLGGLGFVQEMEMKRYKVSYTDYGNGQKAGGNQRPSLVPEGTLYTFEASEINADLGEVSFRCPVIYDILPHQGDRSVVGSKVKPDDPTDRTYVAAERNTSWTGVLDLDSIGVTLRSSSKNQTMVDGKDVEIWVGPFKKNGNTIVAQSMDTLPVLADASEKELYDRFRKNTSEKEKYFVRLSDLKMAANRGGLTRKVGAIYVEPKTDFSLTASKKLVLSYSFKAPVNLPMYPGYLSESETDVNTMMERLKGYLSVNSFAAQIEDEKPVESNLAAVYLDAPADKGYIGHYVWLDEDYSGTFIDDASYERRDGSGRWIRTGGETDPGINGVKVELLSESGYPVNRLGEPVRTVNGHYEIVDEKTGNIQLGADGRPKLSVYGPASYTTQEDAYGNNGYFIISNITPGKYRLRYTFPETYDEYAVTTRFIGTEQSAVQVYRPGDILMGQEVKTLIIEMRDAVQIDSIGTNPSTYPAYDARMTTYDVGVAPAYYYGGYAWEDVETENKAGSIIAGTETDGWMHTQEKRLENVRIRIYEVHKDGSRTPAYDADGKDLASDTASGAVGVNQLYTDEEGHFCTTLYPNRSYVAVAETNRLSEVYEVSPVTLSTDPLAYPIKPAPSASDYADNDLTYDKQAKENVTSVFTTGRETGAAQIKNAKGSYGPYDKLGFAFVPKGRGYIGKHIFNDKNYDGLRGMYVDENGDVCTEPGISGVKLVLEQYYYDGSWKLAGDCSERTSTGPSYLFSNVRTTYFKDGQEEQKYLAGYRVKIKLTDLSGNSADALSGYVPTKYLMGDGMNDSDLPVVASSCTKGILSSDGVYRYLNTEPIVVAEEVKAGDDSVNQANILEINGVRYDTANGRMVLDVDAGFVKTEYGSISGMVWEDKEYDGIRGTYLNEENVQTDEPGIEGVNVTLIPYIYRNGTWMLLTQEDLVDTTSTDTEAAKRKAQEEYKQYSRSLRTDASGTYCFEDIRPTVVSGGNSFLAGYQIELDHALEQEYVITKYRQGEDPERDSDLLKQDHRWILNKSDEMIFTGEKIPADRLEELYGSWDKQNRSYLVQNALGYFDGNRAKDRTGYGAGLRKLEGGSIAGRVWLDADYDGIMDEGLSSGAEEREAGLAGRKVLLRRYCLKNGIWTEDTDFGVQSTWTDADGNYEFVNLSAEIYRDDTYCLAGYKVSLEEHPDPARYAVTLYRQAKSKGQRDSDLKGLNLNADGEYVILAEKLDKPDSDLLYMVEYEGAYYDLLALASQDGYDAGYVEFPQSKITGVVFDDLNYNGRIDEKGEGFSEQLKQSLLVSKEEEIVITARAWYYEPDGAKGGTWKLYHPNGTNSDTDIREYRTAVTPDSVDGRYELEVPTQFYIGGRNYLAGYELRVNQIPTDYHVTMHLATGDDTPENTALKMGVWDYRVRKTDLNGIYHGKTAEESEGLLVAAMPSDNKDSANLVFGYDLAGSRTLVQYNIGYTIRQTTEIEGVVFLDENYNGKYDGIEGNDVPLAGIPVGIKRYEWDEKLNIWTLKPRRKSDEYFATAVTGADGWYHFEELLTHEICNEDEDTSILYGYTVWLLDTPEGENGEELASTYYQANGNRMDSALQIDTMQLVKNPQRASTGYGEMKDGCTVLATKLAEDEEEQLYSVIVDGYDCARGTKRDGYNAGFVKFQTGSIEGNVFEDMDYNGILDAGDRNLSNVRLGLKRFQFDPVTRVWLEDQKESEEGEQETYFRTAVTDGKGHYVFDSLPTSEKRDGQWYLYGYELWVIPDPEEEPGIVTRYQVQDGTGDSALTTAYQIVKKQGRHEELLEGKIVVAGRIRPQDRETVADRYCIGGYNIIFGNKLSDYNAGYVPERLYHISGTVWEDVRRDGVLDENHPFAGVEVCLERLYYADGKWHELEGLPTDVIKTDQKGFYCFENLELTGKVNGKTVLYGYRVKMRTLPDLYSVTLYQVNDGNQDNDLNEKTGYLESQEALMILADPADGTTFKEYMLEGRNIVWGNSVECLDAGLLPYGTGSLAGIVFKDEDRDGVYDKKEEIFAGETVSLEYSSGGAYQPYADLQAVTDSRGYFSFENLPLFDENGEVYSYRLRMDTPEYYELTQTYSMEESAAGHRVNVFQADTEDRLRAQAQKGSGNISPAVTLAQRRNEKNYYNLLWEADGRNYTRIDAGYYPAEEDEDESDLILPEDQGSTDAASGVKTGDDTPIWLFVLLLLLSGFGFSKAVYDKKRRLR